jgi:hypothetical protein
MKPSLIMNGDWFKSPITLLSVIEIRSLSKKTQIAAYIPTF